MTVRTNDIALGNLGGEGLPGTIPRATNLKLFFSARTVVELQRFGRCIESTVHAAIRKLERVDRVSLHITSTLKIRSIAFGRIVPSFTAVVGICRRARRTPTFVAVVLQVGTVLRDVRSGRVIGFPTPVHGLATQTPSP